MKKTTILILCFGLLLPSLSGFAQETKRTHQIGNEKFRSVLENYKPSGHAPQGNRGGEILFFENFDEMGGVLPDTWEVSGNSETCMWGVDDTPNPPGFYSPSYSLNYNNGVNYDCGYNFGSVTTPPIDVYGASFTVSFQYLIDNECGESPCGEDATWDYDNAYLLITDVQDNLLTYTGIEGNTAWNLTTFYFPNDEDLAQVKLVFYFDTGDDILNDFAGPFIDNLQVTSGSSVPLSGWSLAIGAVFIAAFVAFRYWRKA